MRNGTTNGNRGGAAEVYNGPRINQSRDRIDSTSNVELGEASRGLRIHVKESEQAINANNNFALAA